MSSDPYWDCPICELTRYENPCEHCGHLYTPKSETSEGSEVST